MLGRTFGSRYQVQEKIGQGGMAVVYKGLDTLLGRTVTIKVLRENLTEDPDLVRSFRREAYAAASLSHPNIVNVYDVGKEDNAYYIVMEYVEGKTLKEIIQEEGPLAPSRAVSFARQICDALHDAHRHNIIHRDIKPQNILITRDGRVKVTDFGIARAVTAATITYTSSVMGSVHYFSPEQAQGGVAKEKSDLYSVGIVLYEMLTGRVPFSGDSPVSVALKHVQEEVPPPSDFNPDIPLSLENLVMKAVEKNPDNRFSSAEEFSRELQHLEKELVREEKNSPSGTSRKGARKKRSKLSRKQVAWIAVGSIALIALLVTGYLLLRSYLIVPEVEVPEVEGLTLEQGISKLQAAGLKFEVEQVPSRDVEAGHIISQDPEAGRKVRKERVIRLLLSTGPSFAEVPDVVGKSELDARIALGAADLEPEVEERYSDEVPVGQVIEQFPEGGSRLLKGETVKIVVSKGGQPVKLKDLRGMSLEDAKNWLEAYDLRVGYIDEVYSDDVPKGRVVSQFPEPDQMVPKGDAVDLVISKGPDVDNLQVYRISITIPPDRIPPGSEIEITVEDVLGKRTESIVFDGEEIIVEGYGSGKVTIAYQGQEIATESFPD